MPHNNLQIILCLIWGLLISASLIVAILVKIYRDKNFTELVQRVKSWWVMIALFTFALLVNQKVSLVFIGFLSFLAVKEFFSIIPTKRIERRVLFWAYISIPIQFYWINIQWFNMFLVFIPVYMFLFIPFQLLLTQNTEGFLKSVATIQWGLMITVFALSHMAYLLTLSSPAYPTISGAGLLLYLVFLTEFNDVMQYTTGKLFGKNKIIPLVSPKKTWEGLIGGCISTIILAICIYTYLTPMSLSIAILSGFIISIGGFIGDITISAVKRDLQIKDTGSLIPGHGGILDRIDSLTYAAPLFFHFINYFYY